MLKLRIADVGDGACSAIYSRGRANPALLIDCGSQQGPAIAMAGLKRIAGSRFTGDRKVVVTHLHEDHFNGLLGLAAKATSSGEKAFERLTLVQARIPAPPPTAPADLPHEFLLRMVTLSRFLGEHTGAPDLDFAEQLNGACAYPLKRELKSRGEVFTAKGYSFDVLWPPKSFGPHMSKTITDAVGMYDGLAKKDSELARLLAQVRESGEVRKWYLPHEERDESGAKEPREPEPGAEPFVKGGHDAPGSDDADGQYPAIHGERTPPPRRRERYSPELRDEVYAAARKFREAANWMSLVFATAPRDFVCWGDVSLGTAKYICQREAVAPGKRREHPVAAWDLVLAPHHGSLGTTSSLGQRFICISQDGRVLHPKHHKYHDESECPGDWCVTTHGQGDMEFQTWRLRQRQWW